MNNKHGGGIGIPQAAITGTSILVPYPFLVDQAPTDFINGSLIFEWVADLECTQHTNRIVALAMTTRGIPTENIRSF